MKPEIIGILACPVCKGILVLEVVDEKEGDVITGFLYCGKCDHSYPIEESIPNLLPPELDS